MCRILILGSSGLIGSHIFKKIKHMGVIGTFQNDKLCEVSNFIRISIPKDLDKLEDLIKKKKTLNYY
jgi:nucleoside-diphosphate-sugar epimerase